MNTINHLTNENTLRDQHIVGTNRDKDVGLFVHVDSGKELILPSLEFENVFIPIIKTGDGKLTIDGDLTLHAFGGDAINIRGSHFHINGMYDISNNTATRPYDVCYRKGVETIAECLARRGEFVYDHTLLVWEKDAKGREYIGAYHQDTIFQAYAVGDDGYTVDPSGIVEDIYMPSVKATITGAKAQGVICSEPCDINNVEIGTRFLEVSCEHPYPFLFNTARNLKVGNPEAVVTGKVRVIKRKETIFSTEALQVVGVGLHTDYKEGETMIATRKESKIYQPKQELEGKLSLGYKNNNCGNITVSSSRWKGLIDAVEINGATPTANGLEYCVFSHPVYGIRALAIDLRNKQVRRKLLSVTAIMNRYAPLGKDNPHQKKYIMFICSQIGCTPTQTINTGDRKVMRAFIKAIVLFENGVQNPIPYPKDFFEEGMTMAGLPERGETVISKPLRNSAIIKGSTVVGTTTVAGIATKSTEIVEKVKTATIDSIAVTPPTWLDWVFLMMLGGILVAVLFIVYDRYTMKQMGIK